MEATGNIDVLRGVIRMSAADEKHICQEDIATSLTSFVERFVSKPRLLSTDFYF